MNRINRFARHFFHLHCDIQEMEVFNQAGFFTFLLSLRPPSYILREFGSRNSMLFYYIFCCITG